MSRVLLFFIGVFGMENLPITVTKNYVDWGIKEGVRELIQNAIDAQNRGYEVLIEYDTDSRMLMVSNQGIILPRRVLALGYTDKKYCSDQIGQFGEGLKLGSLALINAGLDVEIWNGKEGWRPTIRESKALKTETLNFEIWEPNEEIPFMTTPGNQEGFHVYVCGISSDQWDKIKGNFLYFQKGKYTAFDTPFGRVISNPVGYDPEYVGNIYINGILVERIEFEDEAFQFGYDINPGHIKVDRDRNMIARHELKTITTKMWNYLGEDSDDHFDYIENLLNIDAPDIEGFRWQWNVSEKLKNKIYKSFCSKYGEKAFPVKNHDEKKQAEFAGKEGIILSENLVQIVQDKTGGLEKLKESFRKSVSGVFDTLDLTTDEASHLFEAWRLLTAVVGVKLPKIQVCSFDSNTTMGLFKLKDNEATIYIARRILKNFDDTLSTLVHEYCHVYGEHDDKRFLDQLERVWQKLFMRVYR